MALITLFTRHSDLQPPADLVFGSNSQFGALGEVSGSADDEPRPFRPGVISKLRHALGGAQLARQTA
jgi:hypothetical protein